MKATILLLECPPPLIDYHDQGPLVQSNCAGLGHVLHHPLVGLHCGPCGSCYQRQLCRLWCDWALQPRQHYGRDLCGRHPCIPPVWMDRHTRRQLLVLGFLVAVQSAHEHIIWDYISRHGHSMVRGSGWTQHGAGFWMSHLSAQDVSAIRPFHPFLTSEG